MGRSGKNIIRQLTTSKFASKERLWSKVMVISLKSAVTYV